MNWINLVFNMIWLLKIIKNIDKISKEPGIKSMPNQQLAKELNKPNIRKFKKRTMYSSFKVNIWSVF